MHLAAAGEVLPTVAAAVQKTAVAVDASVLHVHVNSHHVTEQQSENNTTQHRTALCSLHAACIPPPNTQHNSSSYA